MMKRGFHRNGVRTKQFTMNICKNETNKNEINILFHYVDFIEIEATCPNREGTAPQIVG